MEAILFTPGPQIAGTEVIDQNGVHWLVRKNIASASAQPREGVYYTKVVEVVPAPTPTPTQPPVDILADVNLKISELTTKNQALESKVSELTLKIEKVLGEPTLPLEPLDFYIDEELKTIRYRIKK